MTLLLFVWLLFVLNKCIYQTRSNFLMQIKYCFKFRSQGGRWRVEGETSRRCLSNSLVFFSVYEQSAQSLPTEADQQPTQHLLLPDRKHPTERGGIEQQRYQLQEKDRGWKKARQAQILNSFGSSESSCPTQAYTHFYSSK